MTARSPTSGSIMKPVALPPNGIITRAHLVTTPSGRSRRWHFTRPRVSGSSLSVTRPRKSVLLASAIEHLLAGLKGRGVAAADRMGGLREPPRTVEARPEPGERHGLAGAQRRQSDRTAAAGDQRCRHLPQMRERGAGCILLRADIAGLDDLAQAAHRGVDVGLPGGTECGRRKADIRPGLRHLNAAV